MESAHIQAGSSNTWGNSKSARAEETSTAYKPPACEDSPSSPEQQPAQLPRKQNLDPVVEEIDEEGSSSLAKDKAPVAASSLSKQSTVTWSEFPPTRYPPSESTARFSQATTAVSQDGYKGNRARRNTPVIRRIPTVRPVNSSMTSNGSASPSNRNRRSRTDIRVDEYAASENESEDESSASEDSWDFIGEEIRPEDSVSRPPIVP